MPTPVRAPQWSEPTARRLVLWSDSAAAAGDWQARLTTEGLAVQTVPASAAVVALADAKADAMLMLLTRGLPDHLTRLRELRQLAPWTALLVACHPLRELDQVLALEMGADDMLDAQWSAPVIAARLRALWRRAARSAPGTRNTDSLRFGALAIRPREREVTQGGRVVPLTEGEFEVLWLLASHAGSALSRRDILQQVRGIDDRPLDRSIDSRIYRIRVKLGDQDNAQQRIRTVRHRGYLFSPQGW